MSPPRSNRRPWPRGGGSVADDGSEDARGVVGDRGRGGGAADTRAQEADDAAADTADEAAADAVAAVALVHGQSRSALEGRRRELRLTDHEAEGEGDDHDDNDGGGGGGGGRAVLRLELRRSRAALAEVEVLLAGL